MESGDRKPEERIEEAPHAVVAAVADLEAARLLIEDLEEHGIPPGALALLGAAPEGGHEAAGGGEAESAAFDDVTKSAIAGGAVGAATGGILGSLVTLALPGTGILVAGGLGAVFGAGVGGAAGGMAVAKYNSDAWSATYETVQLGEVAVGVHHADRSVIDAARQIIDRHHPRTVEEFESPES